ncbi:MAG: TIR domain-containing protein, partial [Terriglobia bacterium]
VEVWTDSKIGTGEDWEKEISEALQNACVAILVVSASSLNTKYILKEERARLLRLRDQEGLRIFPLIATDCGWGDVTWLANMQVRPRDRRPLQEKSAARKNSELTNLAAEIAKIIGASTQTKRSVPSESPGERQNRALKPEPAAETAEERVQRLTDELRVAKENLPVRSSASVTTPTSSLESTYQGKQTRAPRDSSRRKTENKRPFEVGVTGRQDDATKSE